MSRRFQWELSRTRKLHHGNTPQSIRGGRVPPHSECTPNFPSLAILHSEEMFFELVQFYSQAARSHAVRVP